MPPLNRIVAFFTPVFAAGAAVGTGWLARHFPGLPLIPSGDLIALEITGATAAAGAALKWLHGSQAVEKYTHEAELLVKTLEHNAIVEGFTPQLKQDADKIIKEAEARVQEAETRLQHESEGRRTAEQKAGVALTQLAHAKAALAADPFLTVASVPTVLPQSITQPVVATDVPNLPEQELSQGAATADVPTIPEQTQQS